MTPQGSSGRDFEHAEPAYHARLCAWLSAGGRRVLSGWQRHLLRSTKVASANTAFGRSGRPRSPDSPWPLRPSGVEGGPHRYAPVEQNASRFAEPRIVGRALATTRRTRRGFRGRVINLSLRLDATMTNERIREPTASRRKVALSRTDADQRIREQTMTVGLITRRSQVQILSPPKKPWSATTAGQGFVVHGLTSNGSSNAFRELWVAKATLPQGVSRIGPATAGDLQGVRPDSHRRRANHRIDNPVRGSMRW